MYAPLSPGRIFRLDEDTMTIYLETLDKFTDSALQYDETAGLKQVYRHRDLTQMELLERNTMDNIPLSDLYQVRGRFHRSIHLERDFYTKENVLRWIRFDGHCA